MKKGTIILSILALIANACGGKSSGQKQTERQSENAVMPDTISLSDLQEKEGIFFWNGKLYTGVAIREYNEEEWDAPGLMYEMKDGVYHGKHINHGPGWHITGNYNENRPDGKWEIHDHTESEIQYFVDGKKHGIWEFYADGDLVKKQTFENDILVNEQTFYPITGMYRSVKDENCVLSLLIGKENEDLVYILTINGRKIRGKLSFYDDNGGFKLERVPWLENHPDIPADASDPTFEIYGRQKESNIVLQTYEKGAPAYETICSGGRYVILVR
jgi:hypothetical protein